MEIRKYRILFASQFVSTLCRELSKVTSAGSSAACKCSISLRVEAVSFQFDTVQIPRLDSI
jgi:hypothetical protein